MRVWRWVLCAGAQRSAPAVCGLEDAHVFLRLGDLAVHEPRSEHIRNMFPSPPWGPLHSLPPPQPTLASARLYATPRALCVHPFVARFDTQKAPTACYRFARYSGIYTALRGRRRVHTPHCAKCASCAPVVSRAHCVRPDWTLNFARKGRVGGIRCELAYRAKWKAVRTRRA